MPVTQQIIDFLLARKSAPIDKLHEPGPSDEEIATLIRIASRVPDHGRLVPWRFILYRGDARHEIGGKLAAQLTDAGPDIPRGLIWRVFKPEPDQDGRLPLVASSQGGTGTFQLDPGSYLVHASFGRAGATKRITVGRESRRENLVLDAGGLKLDALLSGGVRIPAGKLRFSIYEAETDPQGDRALIIPNVEPNRVVRLNSGTYHVVSTYGSVNAVIRSDIRVEAGRLTEAMVEHRAAQLTMKLVRDEGSEAIADTSWSVLTDTGDIVKEIVGAYASMVLAEGNYTVVAKNRDRIYQKDFEVVAGRNTDIEVLTDNPVTAAKPAPGEESLD